MISIIGSLFGFSTSFVPKILDHFTEKQKFKNQMALMQAQSQMKVSEANALAKIQQNNSRNNRNK